MFSVGTIKVINVFVYSLPVAETAYPSMKKCTFVHFYVQELNYRECFICYTVFFILERVWKINVWNMVCHSCLFRNWKSNLDFIEQFKSIFMCFFCFNIFFGVRVLRMANQKCFCRIILHFLHSKHQIS